MRLNPTRNQRYVVAGLKILSHWWSRGARMAQRNWSTQLLTALVLGAWSVPTLSDDVNAAPSEHDGTVLSMVFADWNDDSIPDKAALVKHYDDHDYATLVVDLSSATDEGKSSLAIKLDDFAWDGFASGTRASLSLSKVGSLVVNSGNSAVGRDRWEHRLYIAYRSQNMVVAGFYYGTRDTVTRKIVNCDVNYLAGYGYKNTERFTFRRDVIDLKDWTETNIHDVCR